MLDLLRRTRRAAIYGCAGSGKTTLAVEKARRLAEEGFCTLLTCYNKALGSVFTESRRTRLLISLPWRPTVGTGSMRQINISWITELGNRVQGEDSMDKIVKAIYMMAEYHREREHLTWQQVEAIAKQANDIRQSG